MGILYSDHQKTLMRTSVKMQVTWGLRKVTQTIATGSRAVERKLICLQFLTDVLEGARKYSIDELSNEMKMDSGTPLWEFVDQNGLRCHFAEVLRITSPKHKEYLAKRCGSIEVG